MKSNTPEGILQMKEQQILDLVDDTDCNVHTNKANRLGIIKIIYSLLGYNLTNDILLALLDETLAILVIATAGGGKTTMSQIKLIIEKIIRKNPDGTPIKGNTMLCLVYNKQNVGQMKKKHVQLVQTLYAKGLTGIKIDDDIVCRTMHSFCCEWRNEYIMQMGLLGAKLIEEDQQRRMLSSLVRSFAKKYEIDEKKFSIANLLKFYNLVHECLRSYDDMHEMLQFEEVGMEASLVKDFYESYDKLKKSKSLYDYTDMLTKLVELLRTNEGARKTIQDHYSYIVADEVQDFTPIMMEILRLIKGENTPLMEIGDEDQCIYTFRGADITTTLSFNDIFKGGKIFILGENRRCAINIFKASEFLISHNKYRFDKEIFSNKPGGHVEYNKYYSSVGQIINIMDKLKGMSLDELNNTVICYRERASSLRLTSILAENRIPFHIISGYSPFSHELFTHMTEALDLLYFAKKRDYLINLFKITELTKHDCHKLLKYSEKVSKFKDDDEHQHFIDRDYGDYNKRMSFLMTMKQIYEISIRMKTEPLESYVEEVWELLKKYYWNWKKQNNISSNNTEEIDNYFEEQIMKVFKVKRTYEDFLHDFEDKERILSNNQKMELGVEITTFHGLKGLEYKNVFIIDLADDIFPNFSRIELQEYSEENTDKLKESETRLMFVAMTRAIENLYMYYNGDNPSIYVSWLLEWEENKAKGIPAESSTPSLSNLSNDNLLQMSQFSSEYKSEKVARSVEPVIEVEKESAIDEIDLELDLDLDLGMEDKIDASLTNNEIVNETKQEISVDAMNATEVRNSLENKDNLVPPVINSIEEVNDLAFEHAKTNDNFKNLIGSDDDFMNSISNVTPEKKEEQNPPNKTTEEKGVASSGTINAANFLQSVLGNI